MVIALPSAASTSALVLLPGLTAACASRAEAMLPAFGVCVAQPPTQTRIAMASETRVIALSGRGNIVVHVFKPDQRVVRPGLIAERQEIGAVDQDFAIAVRQVSLQIRICSGACVQTVDRNC